jgi:type I restriction enzyme, R subunit
MAVVEDNEKRFEEDIESYLLSHGGYTKGTQGTYDRDKAISVSTLIAYLEETQSNEWRKYQRIYQEKAAEQLVKRLNEQISTNGLVHVLRNGIADRGVRLKVASFRPETSLNATVGSRSPIPLFDGEQQLHRHGPALERYPGCRP